LSRYSASASTLLTLLLLLLLLTGTIAGVVPILAHSNASSAPKGISLVNSEGFNDYGQFGVNDTVVVGTNTNQSLSSVTFGFPSTYNGHVFAQSATLDKTTSIPATGIQTVLSGGTLLITITLPSGNTLSSKSPGNVSLMFYVIGVYHPENSTSQSCTTCYYQVPMLLYPSISLNGSSISLNSNITFPDSSVTQPSSNSTAHLGKLGFATQTIGSLVRLYNYTTVKSTNSSYVNTPHWTNASVGSTAGDAGIVDFQNIKRSISVGSSGNLIVTDSFQVANFGPNTLNSLDFSVLTGPGTSTVTILPSGQPLLSNAQTATATSGILDILSASGLQIEPNATVLVIVQYPLGQQYWSLSGGTYKASIPLSVPINAVVDKFIVTFDIPSGFVALQTPPTVDLAYTRGALGNSTLSYRAGVGSAYLFVLPVASIVFLGVFVAALIFKPRGLKKGEEIETTLSSLIKSVEDKVSGTNDILTELKSKGSAVTKVDLATSRTRIEDLRSKSSGRFASIRTELGLTSSASATVLNQVATDDREFDRAVKDLLNSYDQFIAKRMKQESFARAQQNNDRRIQRITNSLLDGLQNLRREYEQER
jgi:hypothetical protein